MTPFRGDDETLDKEIATLEGIAHTRSGRAARELRGLQRELHELKLERARRRARAGVEQGDPVPTSAEA